MAILVALARLIQNLKNNDGDSTVITPGMPGKALHRDWAAF